MSALGQKQTCAVQLGMSAIGHKRTLRFVSDEPNLLAFNLRWSADKCPLTEAPCSNRFLGTFGSLPR